MSTSPRKERPKEASSGAAEAASVDVDTCGIVMPISELDGCTEGHWAEVLTIISDSITGAGLRPNLVSNADEVGIIQKRIIQNLYDNAMVVCDVSGKNPNVMFELGLRLAFDKPTIIIKDDKTDYSFDTAPIEHLDYPRDLRYSQILTFKSKLSDKIKATLLKSRSDVRYTTFLKHFGEFQVVEIEKKEVSQTEFIAEELSEIRRYLRNLDSAGRISRPSKYSHKYSKGFCLEGMSEEIANELLKAVSAHPGVVAASLEDFGDHVHLEPIYGVAPDSVTDRTRQSVRELVRERRRLSS